MIPCPKGRHNFCRGREAPDGRIIYRKVDGNLVARIEGRVQEKDQSMEWTWKPVVQQ